MDASKFLNQVLSIFDGSWLGRQRCMGFDVVMMEDNAFPIDQFWLLSLDCLA